MSTTTRFTGKGDRYYYHHPPKKETERKKWEGTRYRPSTNKSVQSGPELVPPGHASIPTADDPTCPVCRARRQPASSRDPEGRLQGSTDSDGRCSGTVPPTEVIRRGCSSQNPLRRAGEVRGRYPRTGCDGGPVITEMSDCWIQCIGARRGDAGDTAY
jgi:hypothetical protein